MDQGGTSSTSNDEISVDEAIERIGFGRFQIGLIAICGILMAVDAIEMLLLSVLGPAVSCEWGLSGNEVAFITTAVFLGMLIGCPLWGALADNSGRWAVLLLTTIFIAYFGLLSAGSPTYIWLVLLRALVGFGMAGVAASSSCLFSEFMTRSARAPAMVCSSAFWSVGGLVMAGLAYAIVPRYGWRWLVVCAAFPLLIALTTFAWLPRSPRFLLLSRRPKEARAIINRIARINGKPEISCGLHTDNVARGTCAQLFHRNYWRGSLLLWFLWLGSGFCYYGIVLVAAEIPTTAHPCLQDRRRTSRPGSLTADTSCCQELHDSSYMGLLVSSLGEFLALPYNAVFLELIGRKPTMMITCFCGALFFFLLNLCAPPAAVDALLLLARATCQAMFSAVYVYTTEFYPTSVRVLGMGWCSALARVGAMLTPFVAQMLLPFYSVLGATSIYAGVMVLMAVCVALLPVETKGRPLPQTVNDVVDGEEGNTLIKGDTVGYSSLKKD